MNESIIIAFSLMIIVTLAFSLYIFRLKKEQKEKLKKLSSEIESSANVELKKKLEEEKRRLKSLQNAKLLEASLQNKATKELANIVWFDLSNYLKESLKLIPKGVFVESNLYLSNVKFQTSRYYGTVLDTIFKQALASNSSKISLDFKEMKKSFRIVYKDNHDENQNTLMPTLLKMKEFDPLFWYQQKVGSNKYPFQLEMAFDKELKHTEIGKFYTEAEININYGTELLDSAKMSHEEFRNYLNKMSKFALFKLENNQIDLAKMDNALRYSLLTGEKIDVNVVYRVLSLSMVKEFLASGNGSEITFENRLKGAVKTFVIGNGTLWIQGTSYCPPFCPNMFKKLDDSRN